MTPKEDLTKLAGALGHDFQNIELLRDALTHRSFANEHPEQAPRDNERLEFLGDSVLSLCASALLWERFPAASEGELTRLRADLVCEAGLAELARALSLGAALRLGKGEDRSGGRSKPRLLCCAFEACIAAVFLDGGLHAASRVVQNLFEHRLAAPCLGQRDFKTRVQEAVQAQGGATPRYAVIHADGPDHARVFHVSCLVQDAVIGQGSGRSKVEAEQDAAQNALARLEEASRAP